MQSRTRWLAIRILVTVVAVLATVPALGHPVPIDTSVPCPTSTPDAGFTDIAGFDSSTQRAINCVAAFGISQGTTAAIYSPGGTVTRSQMALFLVRQAAAHGLTVPAASDQGYIDIGGLPAGTQDAVNQLTQLGISTGTSLYVFSPEAVVTRWQMALFLRRLAELAGVTVIDDPTGETFSDIGAYSTEIQGAINFLADGHIALGTSEGVFSGNNGVLRWQMALFLTRVLAADGISQP